MSKALDEARAALAAKQSELAAIFEEAGPDMDLAKVTSLSGDTATKAAEIRRRNDELAELAEKVESLEAVEKAAALTRRMGDYLAEPDTRLPQPGATTPQAPKTVGDLVVESPAFRGYKGGSSGPVAEIDVELKTLFQTTAGWPPETTRTGRLIEAATRPIQVLDLYPQTTTNQNAVVYMEETTFTNAAAETAEGGAYPEAALALTEKSSPVRKIAVFLPVTDEQFDDEQRARDYVNNRLIFMLRQRLDRQTLVGDGVAPNLAGILNVSGIQTQAKGTDPTPDAIYKAITKCRVTGRANPDAVVVHPNDWQDIRLLRTVDGIYVWGSPSEAGPARIWGLPVVVSDAITENTGLVGDFGNFTELAARRGVEVQVSNAHASYFTEGKLAIRADVRVAFIVYRPAAFCTVTGI